jgi:hypothetical protein
MKGAGGGGTVPVIFLDRKGWIKLLPSKTSAVRRLSIPSRTTDVICRWQGNDHNSMTVSSHGGISNIVRTPGTNELRFRYVSSYPAGDKDAWITFDVDASNYVRDIDCRDSGVAVTEVFDPTFVRTLEGFRVLRFMKWQFAVEANRPVTWANRNIPGAGNYLANDGVPIEHMIALANTVNADPWFCIPWNADDDYVTHFATYVRDHLRPGGKAFVELSNEVWNGGYPVMHQAQTEGIAETLPAGHGTYGQAMFRYAEKTRHIMQIWSRVFDGQENRLVRVISAQNVSPFWSEQILGYQDTAQYVDALATAPYWAFGDGDYKGQSLDEIMTNLLPGQISDTLNWALQQKAVAQKYGKRYLTYEGGQHVWLNEHPSIVAQVERDPRMADLYTSYMDQWEKKFGDTLTLFAVIGPIGNSGFGLVEYPGQPDAEAPKMRAVRSFLARQTN